LSDSRKQLIHQLFETIGGIFRGLRGGHGELLKKYGLGRSQAFLLFAISHHEGGMSVKDLADKCHITSGGVTQQIDALVDQDLLERVESQEDRRVVLIKLTKKAKNELKTFKQAQFNEIVDAFNELSNDDVAKLINLLGKIKVKDAKCNCPSEAGKTRKDK
jgi:DNA-binding MarR family transcriptional regulator